MREKIVMITGANAGIGYETARRLAETGATVVLLCRNAARGAKALDRIVAETGNEKLRLLICDLASQADIHRAVREFGNEFARLNVLINNAAMYTPERTMTADGIETQFAVNILSYFLLTNLLIDTLKASAPARVINLTTINHFQTSLDLDDLQAERSNDAKDVHMRSKLAVILFTYELSRRLSDTGVTVNCVHPGVIATKLLGEVRGVPPEKHFQPAMGGDPLEFGAKTPFFLATSADVEGVSGKYFDDCRAIPSSDETYDETTARRLWEISATLTGLDGKSP